MLRISSRPFIAQLNAVRFLAAIAIVIFHYGRWSFPFTLSFVQPYVLNANTGVTLFFVLSGFIMAHVYGTALSTLDKRRILAFYRARIARIVPLYLVALLLTAWSLFVMRESFPIRSFFLQLFFLQSWIPHEPLRINFAGWSLSVEMLFYALFPFAFYVFRRLHPSKQLFTTIALWFVSSIVMAWFVSSYFPDVSRSNVLLKFFPLLHLNSFLIGMFAGIRFSRSNEPLNSNLIFAALLTLIVFPFLLPQGMWPLFHNGLLAPAFAILIFALARIKHDRIKWLAARPFIVGGDLSYGIYILQVPIYNWVYLAYERFNMFDALREEGRFFLYLTSLCVASWISFHTIERYGKRLIRPTG